LIGEGLKALWNPDEAAIHQCVEYGEKFASMI